MRHCTSHYISIEYRQDAGKLDFYVKNRIHWVMEERLRYNFACINFETKMGEQGDDFTRNLFTVLFIYTQVKLSRITKPLYSKKIDFKNRFDLYKTPTE